MLKSHKDFNKHVGIMQVTAFNDEVFRPSKSMTIEKRGFWCENCIHAIKTPIRLV